MSNQSRVVNTFRNMTFGLIGQFFIILLNFIYRTIFINTLGINILGINGLFSNILSILSLTELGIGSAITFSLYEPIAKKDENKIVQLLNFYKSAYIVIGCLILIFGVILIPFLSYFIKTESRIENLNIIFLLFLLDTVISYFYAYKKSLLIADQKNYINSLNQNIFLILKFILQVIILIYSRNYIFTLIIQILLTFLSNLRISRIVDRLYPFLTFRKSGKIEYTLKQDLYKKISSMFVHNLGSVIVLGTDNLLISTFLGVSLVGVYSNYLLIINVIRVLIKQFSEGVISSIGNLVVSDNKEKAFEIFNTLKTLNFWVYSFSMICFYVLLNSFITLWIGSEFTLNQSTVFIITLNFYINGLRQNVLSFRNALGLFWNDRYKPIFESIINIVASIYLMKYYGLLGVLLGTLISTLLTSFWVEPYILFKNYFNKNLLSYFIDYMFKLLQTIFIAFILFNINSLPYLESWIGIFTKLVVCIFVYFIFILIFYSKTKEFDYLQKSLRMILRTKQ